MMSSRYGDMEAVLADPHHIPEAAVHADWRVRYAAALAMAQDPMPRWLPFLQRMLEIESERQLYAQPAVRFSVGTGDTRMAEQIGPIEVLFDAEYAEATKEAWRCRGRVRQAVLFAIAAIGTCDDELREMLHGFLRDPDEDFAVKAATARALGMIGHPDSVPFLHMAVAVDEWCTNREARKALQRMGQ